MSCPYLCRQADPSASHDRVIPALCRDPLSGLSIVPGFWYYWNRCTTATHIRCPRYRRYTRQTTPGEWKQRLAVRRSA